MSDQTIAVLTALIPIGITVVVFAVIAWFKMFR
jgi:hypothetical protein